MIPATVYVRLAHRPVAVQKAVGKLSLSSEKSLEGNPLVIYEIDFTAEDRSLRIHFEQDFPHRIQKWQETYRERIGTGAKVLTSHAARTHTIMGPYWKHHTK